MRWYLVILLFFCLVGGVSAQPTAQEGAVTIDNETITIDSVPGDGDITLEDPESNELYYTEDEPWDETVVMVDNDRVTIELQGVEPGQTATWRETNVTARESGSTENSTEIRLSSVDDGLDLDIDPGSAFLILESEEYNTMRLESGVTDIVMKDFDIGNSTLEWTATRPSQIQIEDIFDQDRVILRENGTVIASSQIRTGNAGFNLPARSGNATIEAAEPVIVNGVEIEPIHQSNLNAGEDELPAQDQVFQVEYTITNTANSTRDLNLSSQQQWIETNASRSIRAGGEEQLLATINASKMESSIEDGTIEISSGNETESVYLTIQIQEPSEPISDQSIGLPLIGDISLGFVASIALTLVFVVFVGGWVWLRPRDNDNLWV